MNALTRKMLLEMTEAVADVSQDRDIRVMILTGAGKVFCSGADISGGGWESGLAGTPNELHYNIRSSYQRVAIGVQSLDKPTIAMVNGAAVGAGCDFAFACDCASARQIVIQNSFVKVGLIRAAAGLVLHAAARPWPGFGVHVHRRFPEARRRCVSAF
jgi:enoyl-CoA hydratase/carnithine racemase